MHFSKFPSTKVQVSRWAKIESLLISGLMHEASILEIILPLPYPRKNIQKLKKHHEMSFMFKKVALLILI